MTFYEWIQVCLQHAAKQTEPKSAPIIKSVLKEIEEWRAKD